MNNDLSSVPIFPSRNHYRRLLTASVLLLILVSGLSLWTSNPANINIEAMLDNNPVGLRIFAPSIAVSGQSLEINVQAWDKYERLVGQYSAEVEFDSTDSLANLPDDAK